MKTLIWDANVPWGFNTAKNLKSVLEFFKAADYKLYMTKETYNECPEGIKETLYLYEKNCFECCDVDKSHLQEVVKDCKSVYKSIHTKDDNDYAVISLAIDKCVDFLVSNDFDLINAAKAYKEQKGIPKREVVLMNVAGLIRLMYDSRRDLFDHEKHIRTNVMVFHHFELPNIYKGIHKFGWSQKIAKDKFTPYSQNIQRTLQIVDWTKV